MGISAKFVYFNPIKYSLDIIIVIVNVFIWFSIFPHSLFEKWLGYPIKTKSGQSYKIFIYIFAHIGHNQINTMTNGQSQNYEQVMMDNININTFKAINLDKLNHFWDYDWWMMNDEWYCSSGGSFYCYKFQ